MATGGGCRGFICWSFPYFLGLLQHNPPLDENCKSLDLDLNFGVVYLGNVLTGLKNKI